MNNDYLAAVGRDAEWEDEHHRFWVDRIRNALERPFVLVPRMGHRGLSRAYSRELHPLGAWEKPITDRLTKPDVPFGWTRVKELNRNTVRIMPWWLAVFVLLRENWKHWVFGTLMTMGLWVVDPDGGRYIQEGSPTVPMFMWRFFAWLGVWVQPETPILHTRMFFLDWPYAWFVPARPRGRWRIPPWLRAFVWCFLNDRDHGVA